MGCVSGSHIAAGVPKLDCALRVSEPGEPEVARQAQSTRCNRDAASRPARKERRWRPALCGSASTRRASANSSAQKSRRIARVLIDKVRPQPLQEAAELDQAQGPTEKCDSPEVEQPLVVLGDSLPGVDGADPCVDDAFTADVRSESSSAWGSLATVVVVAPEAGAQVSESYAAALAEAAPFFARERDQLDVWSEAMSTGIPTSSSCSSDISLSAASSVSGLALLCEEPLGVEGDVCQQSETCAEENALLCQTPEEDVASIAGDGVQSMGERDGWQLRPNGFQAVAGVDDLAKKVVHIEHVHPEEVATNGGVYGEVFLPPDSKEKLGLINTPDCGGPQLGVKPAAASQDDRWGLRLQTRRHESCCRAGLLKLISDWRRRR